MFQIRLKELREKKKISQRELAKLLGFSQGTVGNWESGIRKPTFKTLYKLADYFNVSVDYLMGNTDNPQGFVVSYRNVPPLTNEEQEEINRLNAEHYDEMQKRYKTDIKESPSTEGEDKITFDDFTYAMNEEAHELTEEEKEKLLELARFFNENRKKGK